MSRSGLIELDFGNGTYGFRLAWGQLERLQEACDAGPFVIYNRLTTGDWRLADVRETIRYGLIGGGMEAEEALKLVREYVEGRPPVRSLIYAKAVLASALMGPPDEDLSGKDEAANPLAEGLTTSPTESSDLPLSTEMEP